MERIHTDIDESGVYGFDFSKKSKSTRFIITAITVTESDNPQVEDAVKKLIVEFGFTPSGDFYLGFEIKDFTPVPDIAPYKYELERKGQLRFTPYFTRINKIK